MLHRLSQEQQVGKPTPMLAFLLFVAAVAAQDYLEQCDIRVDSYRADPNDCAVFYQCDYKGWVPKTCPSGLAFNTKEQMFVCDWPENVEGCGGTGSNISPCSPNPCQNNGYCASSGNSFTCQCQQGYSGAYCQIADQVSSCFPNPCRNGGYCVGTGNSFTCQCLQGFTGQLCETESSSQYPDCPRYPCPTDVPEYTYPDWTDPSCTQYYLCRYGNLTKVSCSVGSKFNVATLQCTNPNSETFVDCRANIFSN